MSCLDSGFAYETTLREADSKKIEIRLQCSKNSVHRAIEKSKKYEIYDDMKIARRLQKTLQRDDHAIGQAIMQSPTSSCSKMRANWLKNSTDINISTV